MSRFLVVVPPSAGHIAPIAGVAAKLAERGHQVAWAGAEQVVAPIARGARIFDCAVPPPYEPPETIHGFAALRFLWENTLVPLATAMEPGVRAAAEKFRPDLVVADQHALAGALVANRLGLRWVTSASTSSEFASSPARMPKADRWLRALTRDLQQRFGDPRSGEDPRFSRELVLAFTTRELAGSGAGAQVRFFGPVIDESNAGTEFPWAALDPSRRLLVVILNTDTPRRFTAECASALLSRSHRIQTVVVDPAESVPEFDGLVVRRAVPLGALLERASAVVCHAAHDTVSEALYHGVPLVLAPVRDDQPIVADQVVRAGAGIRLRSSTSTAMQIGAAVDAILDEPAFRDGAALIGKSLRGAGGPAAAADALEALVTENAEEETEEQEAGTKKPDKETEKPDKGTEEPDKETKEPDKEAEAPVVAPENPAKPANGSDEETKDSREETVSSGDKPGAP
ncbi:glycosyltransferase [Amycolatopsis pigmentata]|uniref:Glycosyltransferase n=1 Tax=Amycolatopsis pigmentata TaxID=450801 RepID=A0ABW5FZ79_9PSEU